MASINPGILFEELSHLNYQKAYTDESLETLESLAIKQYVSLFYIPHIPVDTYERPKYHEEEVDEMHDKVCNGAALDQQNDYTERYGFRFLNSDSNDILNHEIASRKDKVLQLLNNHRLFEIRKREIEVIDRREHEILQNIYNYSKEHEYNQAILFIGSGHRKSIIEKMESYNEKEGIKLDWNIYKP